MTGFGHRGFTLVEVLVAVFVFALLMIAAYGSVNALLRAREGLAAQNERLRELQFAVGLIERDLRAAIARPVRDDRGEREPALIGSRDAIAFSRVGLANPFAQQRASVERVGYAWRDRALTRLTFTVLDRASDSRPVIRNLLGQVRRIGFRYFDGRQWREQWPPEDAEPRPLHALPKAIEYRIETEDLGTVLRLVDLSDGEEPSPSLGAIPP